MRPTPTRPRPVRTPPPSPATLSQTSASRFAARTRARRWAGLRPLLVAAGVVITLGVVAWVVFWSPLLGVREVRVEGNRTLAAHTVRAAAAVTDGTPLARLDTSATAARVRGLPQVAEVEIRRELPGRVVVRVVERTPVAVVRSGRTYRLVDASGVSYAAVARPPARVPVIEAATRTDAESLRTAVAVVTALPPALRDRVAAVSAPGPHAVTLRLSDGRRVVWGSATDSAKKAAVLAALLPRPAASYDVSAPDAPTTTAAVARPPSRVAGR